MLLRGPGGLLLRGPGGLLADGLDCCCGPPTPCACCPDLPVTLHGQYSNQTGDATGLPTNFDFHQSQPGLSYVYGTNTGALGLPCQVGGSGCEWVLECDGIDTWTLTPSASCSGDAVLVECQCNPLRLVFHITLDGMPCVGSATLTITE